MTNVSRAVCIAINRQLPHVLNNKNDNCLMCITIKMTTVSCAICMGKETAVSCEVCIAIEMTVVPCAVAWQ